MKNENSINKTFFTYVNKEKIFFTKNVQKNKIINWNRFQFELLERDIKKF